MRALGRVVQAVLAIAYPAVLYVGLTRWSARAVGLALLGLTVARAALSAGSRERLAIALRTAAPVAALAGLSALVGDARFVLALPVLINLTLLATFGASLRATPMIERFARTQVSDLSAAELAHCRAVTLAWCALFALNAAVAAALALSGRLAWWALYNGAVAYALIALLFAVEFLVRTYRFRARRRTPVDRLFARLFPVAP